MNSTVTLTGALPAVVIVSAVLTAMVSAFLLWLYRRAVVRAMTAQAGVAEVPLKEAPASTVVRSGMPPALTIIDYTYQHAVAQLYYYYLRAGWAGLCSRVDLCMDDNSQRRIHFDPIPLADLVL